MKKHYHVVNIQDQYSIYQKSNSGQNDKNGKHERSQNQKARPIVMMSIPKFYRLEHLH